MPRRCSHRAHDAEHPGPQRAATIPAHEAEAPGTRGHLRSRQPQFAPQKSEESDLGASHQSSTGGFHSALIGDFYRFRRPCTIRVGARMLPYGGRGCRRRNRRSRSVYVGGSGVRRIAAAGQCGSWSGTGAAGSESRKCSQKTQRWGAVGRARSGNSQRLRRPNPTSEATRLCARNSWCKPPGSPEAPTRAGGLDICTRR